MEPTLKDGPIEARRPRRDEHHVSLWREHLRHVPLDFPACTTALVDAVENHQGAARHQSLAQELVTLRARAVRDEQVGVDPVPHAPKHGAVLFH